MSRTAFGQIRPTIRTIVPEGESGGGSEQQQEQAPEGQQEQQQTEQVEQPKERVEDLPQWAQKLVGDLRKENGADRQNAKQAAADEARKDLAQTVGKALGLVKDEEAVDVAKLPGLLTASQQETRDAKIQLAVYRAAGQHKGNPDALLDSRTFLANVQSLDPASSDFTTQVSDAVKAAVGSTPSLRLVQATGASTADHAPGGETGAITEQQLASMTPEQISKAFDEGRLNHLL